MTIHAALALSALLAAGYLFLFAGASRVAPGVALLAAGVEVAMAMGWLRLALHGPSLALGLGLLLALPGLALWWRAGGKGPLTAASILAFVGLLQVTLAALLRL